MVVPLPTPRLGMGFDFYSNDQNNQSNQSNNQSNNNQANNQNRQNNQSMMNNPYANMYSNQLNSPPLMNQSINNNNQPSPLFDPVRLNDAPALFHSRLMSGDSLLMDHLNQTINQSNNQGLQQSISEPFLPPSAFFDANKIAQSMPMFNQNVRRSYNQSVNQSNNQSNDSLSVPSMQQQLVDSTPNDASSSHQSNNRSLSPGFNNQSMHQSNSMMRPNAQAYEMFQTLNQQMNQPLNQSNPSFSRASSFADASRYSGYDPTSFNQTMTLPMNPSNALERLDSALSSISSLSAFAQQFNQPINQSINPNMMQSMSQSNNPDNLPASLLFNDAAVDNQSLNPSMNQSIASLSKSPWNDNRSLNLSHIQPTKQSNPVFITLYLRFNCVKEDIFRTCKGCFLLSFALRTNQLTDQASFSDTINQSNTQSNSPIKPMTSVFVYPKPLSDHKHYAKLVRRSSPELTLYDVDLYNQSLTQSKVPAEEPISNLNGPLIIASPDYQPPLIKAPAKRRRTDSSGSRQPSPSPPRMMRHEAIKQSSRSSKGNRSDTDYDSDSSMTCVNLQHQFHEWAQPNTIQSVRVMKLESNFANQSNNQSGQSNTGLGRYGGNGGILFLNQTKSIDDIVVSSTGQNGTPRVGDHLEHLSYAVVIKLDQSFFEGCALQSTVANQSIHFEEITRAIELVAHSPNTFSKKQSRSLSDTNLIHCQAFLSNKPLSQFEEIWKPELLAVDEKRLRADMERPQPEQSINTTNQTTDLSFAPSPSSTVYCSNTDIWAVLSEVVSPHTATSDALRTQFEARILNYQLQPLHHCKGPVSLSQMIHCYAMFNWEQSERLIKSLHCLTEVDIQSTIQQQPNSHSLMTLAATQRCELLFLLFVVIRRGGDLSLLNKPEYAALVDLLKPVNHSDNWQLPVTQTQFAQAIVDNLVHTDAFQSLNPYWKSHMHYEIGLAFCDSGYFERQRGSGDNDDARTLEHLWLARKNFDLSRLTANISSKEHPPLRLHALVCEMHEQEAVLQQYLYLGQGATRHSKASAMEMQYALTKLGMLLRSFKQEFHNFYLWLNCSVLLLTGKILLNHCQSRRSVVTAEERASFAKLFDLAAQSMHMGMIVLVKEVQLYEFLCDWEALEARKLAAESIVNKFIGKTVWFPVYQSFIRAVPPRIKSEQLQHRTLGEATLYDSW